MLPPYANVGGDSAHSDKEFKEDKVLPLRPSITEGCRITGDPSGGTLGATAFAAGCAEDLRAETGLRA